MHPENVEVAPEPKSPILAGIERVESIEELLRQRGFFDSHEGESHTK